MEEKPVAFTIIYVSDDELRVYTDDKRWANANLTTDFRGVPPSNLFDCTCGITVAGKMYGYEVIFKADYKR